MTKYGQTYQYTAVDHMNALERYVGRHVDTVLVNTASIPDRALSVYAKSHEVPVVDNLIAGSPYQVHQADLIGSTLVMKSKSDALVRSLIRHDSKKLGGRAHGYTQSPLIRKAICHTLSLRMKSILLIIHLLVAIAMISLILLQSSQGGIRECIWRGGGVPHQEGCRAYRIYDDHRVCGSFSHYIGDDISCALITIV